VAARENVRLIDFDLTGHGCSPFEETATPRDLAERIISTLKLLEVKSYHMVGQGIAWDVVREIMSSTDTPRPTSCGFLDHTSADWLGVRDILRTINEPKLWQFNACIQAIRRTRRTYFQGTERRSVLHSSCLKVEGGRTFSMWCQDGACDACVPDFALMDQYHADLRPYQWTPREFAVMHHLVACQSQNSLRYIETELDALYKQFQTSTTLNDLVLKVEQRIQREIQELDKPPVVLHRLGPAVSLSEVLSQHRSSELLDLLLS